ncbi:MAG: ribosomal biogenesis protein [Desulfurococcaceae archaeon]
MILVTVSRRSTSRIRSFTKDLVSIIPLSMRISRGHRSLVELALEAKKNKLKYVLIVSEWRGNPGSLILHELTEDSAQRAQLSRVATIVLKGVKLSRENPLSSRAYGVSNVAVDYSGCITQDCFYLADLLNKIFEKILSKDPDIVYKLEDNKYLELRAVNSHGRVVGPVIKITRVIPG